MNRRGREGESRVGKDGGRETEMTSITGENLTEI